MPTASTFLSGYNDMTIQNRVLILTEHTEQQTTERSANVTNNRHRSLLETLMPIKTAADARRMYIQWGIGSLLSYPSADRVDLAQYLIEHVAKFFPKSIPDAWRDIVQNPGFYDQWSLEENSGGEYVNPPKRAHVDERATAESEEVYLELLTSDAAPVRIRASTMWHHGEDS